MVQRSRICRGRGLDGWRMNQRFMVSWSMLMHWTIVSSSMVSWISWCVGSRDSCRGNCSSRVLLRVVVGMDTLWGGMRLTHNSGGMGTVGLVDRVTHCRGIALFDDLVVRLVGGGEAEEGGEEEDSHAATSAAAGDQLMTSAG